VNIYMICTLWTPFQAEKDWKNSYREILLIPLYIFYSLWLQREKKTGIQIDSSLGLGLHRQIDSSLGLGLYRQIDSSLGLGLYIQIDSSLGLGLYR